MNKILDENLAFCIALSDPHQPCGFCSNLRAPTRGMGHLVPARLEIEELQPNFVHWSLSDFSMDVRNSRTLGLIP